MLRGVLDSVLLLYADVTGLFLRVQNWYGVVNIVQAVLNVRKIGEHLVLRVVLKHFTPDHFVHLMELSK